MARHRRSRRHSKQMAQQGGYDSAWSYGLETVGNGWTQFLNALTIQPGQNLGTVQSNDIVPIKNINAQNSQPYLGPNLQTIKGGRRRSRRTRSRSRRGGNLGAVVNQAAVPLALLAAQQMYGKRTRKHRHSRRH